MSDAYGKALTAYFNGDKKTRIKVESNVVETEYWNIKEFFHTWEQMSEIEHRALKLCEGRTLDVGAGSGSHTLWGARSPPKGPAGWNSSFSSREKWGTSLS